MKREAWDDIPTMRALVKLKERKGEEDITNLANETGLSKGRVQQLLFAATLPKEYQDLIEQKIIPLNFFYELKLQIDLLSKKRPGVFSKFGTEAILRAFVDKRLAGITKDVVDLRLMRPIINIAMEEAQGPEGTSDLDAVIESLIKDREQTIQEAYENTVEMVVEADKFARQCQQLVARYDRLIAKAQTDEDIEMVEQAIKALQNERRLRLHN
jgi:vacuolar-type H+-ATPase subunit H